MSFDWMQFFDQYGIEYVTAGANVGRGEIGVQCPFCGAADPSHHMSVNLEGRGWVCRRNRAEHRGVAPARLVQAVLGCSAAEARALVGAPTIPGAGAVLAEIESLLGAAPPEASCASPGPRLREPAEFKRFEGKPSAEPYYRYMERRGFPRGFVERASRDMGLRYCTRGPFAGRVLFLVHLDGRLVTWTGRAISSSARLRYRAHTPDPERAAQDGLAPAAADVESCLLWADELAAGGDLLRVVEGPMDALKLRMLGAPATCMFTNTLSESQIDMLRGLAPRWRRRVVLLDKGAEAEAMRAARQLAALGFELEWLPPGVGDPGELDRRSAEKMGIDLSRGSGVPCGLRADSLSARGTAEKQRGSHDSNGCRRAALDD